MNTPKKAIDSLYNKFKELNLSDIDTKKVTNLCLGELILQVEFMTINNLDNTNNIQRLNFLDEMQKELISK